MTKDEAMRLALEALEILTDGYDGTEVGVEIEAITALHQAIEQAEKQEHDLNDVRCECCGYMTYHREHMGCIKAAYQQAEKQEPVAWSVLNKRTGKHWYTHESRYTAQYYANEYSYRESDNTPSMVVTPLYTAPPKREWIGLTDEERTEAANNAGFGHINIALEIEAKLKEKNRD